MKTNPLLVLPLVLVLASCASTEAAEPPAPPVQSGRALFRGLVFFEGDVTRNVPLLQQARAQSKIDGMNTYQKQAFNGYKEYTTKFIERYYPDFFDTFGQMVQSGNPVLVDGALKQAGDLVLEAWALKPLLAVTRPDQAKLVLSNKTQATLARLNAARSIQEVKKMLATSDFSRDLILNESRMLDIDVRLNNEAALNRYADLDYFLYHNLDYATSSYLQRSQMQNVANQLNRFTSYNRMFNLHFDKDIDLGADTWFNENEWLNENRYVNNNENFNLDKNVNLKEDVSIVVEAVLVAVVGFERVGSLDAKSQFMHEELVRSITERFRSPVRNVGRN